ncbi:MAG: hypothetical protein SO424_09100 [[Pasteurella] aerogenes]|nr:hypothetical protein [[Pasteurella] aerogenes]
MLETTSYSFVISPDANHNRIINIQHSATLRTTLRATLLLTSI